jgi:hypothetical protein
MSVPQIAYAHLHLKYSESLIKTAEDDLARAKVIKKAALNNLKRKHDSLNEEHNAFNVEIELSNHWTQKNTNAKKNRSL